MTAHLVNWPSLCNLTWQCSCLDLTKSSWFGGLFAQWQTKRRMLSSSSIIIIISSSSPTLIWLVVSDRCYFLKQIFPSRHMGVRWATQLTSSYVQRVWHHGPVMSDVCRIWCHPGAPIRALCPEGLSAVGSANAGSAAGFATGPGAERAASSWDQVPSNLVWFLERWASKRSNKLQHELRHVIVL